MRIIRSPTPLPDLAIYNPNRSGHTLNRLGRAGASRRIILPASYRRRLGEVTGTLSDGSQISMSSDQVAAAISTLALPVVTAALPPTLTPITEAQSVSAVQTITSGIPAVALQQRLSTPPGASGGAYTFNTQGLSGYGRSNRNALLRLGDTNVVQVASSAGGTAASAIAIDVGLGAYAGPIGAAVGLVVGIICTLFHKKTVSPPTTQAQIQAALSFSAQYQQQAGRVIGRSYPDTIMQDVTMSLCILADAYLNDAGGCKDQAGIANSWGEQLTRLNYFFTALASASVGDTIVLRDIPSLPGHGRTNMGVSFSFPNPGVDAPNYILGPYYSQYFYVMCNIFTDSGDCEAWQLEKPMPQYVCDLIDWYRAKHTGWDIPAGTIDAPVEYQDVSYDPGQVNEPDATADEPDLTAPSSGIPSPDSTDVSISIDPNTLSASFTQEVTPSSTPVNTSGPSALAVDDLSTQGGLSTVIDQVPSALTTSGGVTGSISSLLSNLTPAEIAILIGLGLVLIL